MADNCRFMPELRSHRSMSFFRVKVAAARSQLRHRLASCVGLKDAVLCSLMVAKVPLGMRSSRRTTLRQCGQGRVPAAPLTRNVLRRASPSTTRRKRDPKRSVASPTSMLRPEKLRKCATSCGMAAVRPPCIFFAWAVCRIPTGSHRWLNRVKSPSSFQVAYINLPMFSILGVLGWVWLLSVCVGLICPIYSLMSVSELYHPLHIDQPTCNI